MNATYRFRLAVLGILALLVSLSSLACHGDVFYFAWAGHYVSEGHFNVYQTVYEAGSSHLDGLTYPPLTYLFFGAIVALGKLVGLFQYANWDGPMGMRRTEFFFIRMFYLPFLVMMAWTCQRFTERFILEQEEPERRTRMGRLAFLATLTSPIFLFVGFVMGQFDLMPASLLFLGVYLIASRHLTWGLLAVFAGAWLKNFPIIFALFAAPLLWKEFGTQRTLGAYALCGLLTVLQLRLFRGPGFEASYLAFKHHDYTVIAVSNQNIQVTLSNVLFLALLVACVGLVLFRTRLAFWEQLLFAYAGSMIALLAPRYWMPQYVSWVAPVLVLFLVLLVHLRSPFFPALYLGINGVYLATTCVVWPGNVDTIMFAKGWNPDTAHLGQLLSISRYGNELWTAMSVCLLLVGSLIIGQLFFREQLRARLEPTLVIEEPRQLELITLLSLGMYVGFIAVHLLNLHMHRAG